MHLDRIFVRVRGEQLNAIASQFEVRSIAAEQAAGFE